MAVQVTNTLTAFITSTEDTTGNVTINRGNGNPAVDSTLGQYTQQFKCLGIGVDTPVPFPTPGVEIDQLYIKNNDAAAIITVKWVPTSGALATIIKLTPGSMIMVWETTSGQGMGAVTVASTIAGSFCELFIGAI